MNQELKALRQHLLNNQLGVSYFARLFSNLEKIELPLSKIMRLNLERYDHIPLVWESIKSPADFEGRLQGALRVFPSFIFLLSSQLNNNSAYQIAARQLQVAGIASWMARDLQDSLHLKLFLQSIDAKAPLAELNQKVLSREKEMSYLPKIVHWDLFLIARNYVKLSASKLWPELLENHYCQLGISQLFLRYYFDLMCLAPNDQVGANLHEVFAQFFATLKLHEINYWKQFAIPEKIKLQLEQIIESDNTTQRHPEIRKTAFMNLYAHAPIIHNGKFRKMTVPMQNLLNLQLVAWQKLSPRRQLLVLKTVLDARDAAHVNYLLMQVFQTDKARLSALQEQMRTAGEALADLAQTLDEFGQKVGQPRSNIVDQQAARKQAAHEKMLAKKNANALSENDLHQYFRDYLQKLYDRVKKEGALNQHGIGQYLENFAKNSMEVTKPGKITKKEKEVFEASVEDMLQNMKADQGLNSRDLEEYQQTVQEELKDLENLGQEERTARVENIGIVLNEAAEMSVRKQEASESEMLYEQAMGFTLTLVDGEKYNFTVGQFMNLPIATKEKIRFLNGYVPDPLKPKMFKNLESMQYRIGYSSANPVPIYGEGTLSKKALLRLLFPPPDAPLDLERKMVMIDGGKEQYMLSLRDFFSFPFAEKNGPDPQDWFAQHLQYLKLLYTQGHLNEPDLMAIQRHIEEFPKLSYKKYFNLFKNGKLEETALMAVWGLWNNNGLGALRLS